MITVDFDKALPKLITVDLDKVLPKLITINLNKVLSKLIVIDVDESFRNFKKDVQSMLIFYISDAVLGKRLRDEENDAERTDRIKIRVLIIQILRISAKKSAFAAGINDVLLINSF